MRTARALVGAFALLLMPSVGCDESPAPAPPPAATQPAPAAQERAPEPAPVAAPTGDESPTPEVPKEGGEAKAEPEGKAEPEAQATPEAKAEPEAPLPVANKSTRRSRVLAHYRALRCLSSRGAGDDEIAAAFTASSLSPAEWEQALGELLEAMATSPNGEAAQAIRIANASPCAGGEGP